jgi:hypothetical protein
VQSQDTMEYLSSDDMLCRDMAYLPLALGLVHYRKLQLCHKNPDSLSSNSQNGSDSLLQIPSLGPSTKGQSSEISEAWLCKIHSRKSASQSVVQKDLIEFDQSGVFPLIRPGIVLSQ